MHLFVRAMENGRTRPTAASTTIVRAQARPADGVDRACRLILKISDVKWLWQLTARMATDPIGNHQIIVIKFLLDKKEN